MKLDRTVKTALFILFIQIYGFAFLSGKSAMAQPQWNVIDLITHTIGLHQAYVCISTGRCIGTGLLLILGATWILYNHITNVPFEGNLW